MDHFPKDLPSRANDRALYIGRPCSRTALDPLLILTLVSLISPRLRNCPDHGRGWRPSGSKRYATWTSWVRRLIQRVAKQSKFTEALGPGSRYSERNPIGGSQSYLVLIITTYTCEECAFGFQRSTGLRAAPTSSRRPTRVECGAVLTMSGVAAASSAIERMASTK